MYLKCKGGEIPWTGQGRCCYDPAMRLPITLFMLFILLLPAPAQSLEAEGDAVCGATGLRQTLALLPTVENVRTKRLYACSIYARDLEGKSITMADLPPFIQPEFMSRLTDGDAANGELFGLSVTQPDLAGQQLVRLMIEVPECARYADMIPANLARLDVSVYYGEVDVTASIAAEICRFGAAWCNDCQ